MPRLSRRPAAPLPAHSLLQLMWLASPALPVGGFSYSEGLEAAVERGLVPDEAAARHWLLDQLRLSLGRADLPCLARAARAWQRGDLDEVGACNAWVLTTRETQELRLQTEQMGRSLTEWLRQRAPGDPRVETLARLAGAPSWPVAFALAVVILTQPAGGVVALPLREALMAHAFSWAENMVQAAIKAIPLGQNAGQRILDALQQALPAVIDQALKLPTLRAQAFTPGLAIRSSQHEVQYSRLFRS
jgi:urease accessory protein